MALRLPPGLVPSEVAFLCEMELVTVVPRQRLESIHLLAVRAAAPSRRRRGSHVPANRPRPANSQRCPTMTN